jgi:hypothetical protein
MIIVLAFGRASHPKMPKTITNHAKLWYKTPCYILGSIDF